MGCGASLQRGGDVLDDSAQFDDAVRTELLRQYDTFKFSALHPLNLTDDEDIRQYSTSSPTAASPESGKFGGDENGYQNTENLRETDFDIVDNARTLVEDIQRLIWRIAVPLGTCQKLSMHNELHYDLCLTLVLTSGEKYVSYAHSAILANRSSYFASHLSSIFNSGMRINNGLGSLSMMNETVRVNNNLFEKIIDIELNIPRIVQDIQSFSVVLEFVYSSYFEPSFVKRFIEWSDEGNLMKLIEILALAHEYQLKSLQKICQYHISRIVNANVKQLSEFSVFIETLCPNLSLNVLNMNVKVKVDVEGAFKDSYKMTRSLLPSPAQMKSALENDFEKLYMKSNTSATTGPSFTDYSDVRFAIYFERNSTTRTESSPNILVNGSTGRSRKMFRVHRPILCARSDYFREYFASEHASMTITMPGDTDLTVIKALVHFIYTDRLKETDVDVIKKIFPLAKMYRIQRLRQLCMLAILRNVNEENAIVEFAYLEHLDDQEELRLLGLYKLASLYPKLSLLSSNEKSPLEDTLKVLYRRLNNRLIWKRAIASSNTLDKMVPKRWRYKLLPVKQSSPKRNGHDPFHLVIGVIGDTGVGVSTLVQTMQTTSDRGLCIDGVSVTLEFCETQHVQEMYSKCDGFMLVFSLIDRVSYNNIGNVYKEIQQNAKNKAMIMVGNKNDLIVGLCARTPCVDAKDAINTAVQYNIPYIETNAKLGTNTTECIIQLVKEIFLALHIVASEEVI